MPDILFGFQRLAELHDIRPVQPLLTRSCLGKVRQRSSVDGRELLRWPAQYRPEDSFRGHFEFGLKYERLNFEFLSRLFERVDPADVAAWVSDEPTGRYARRAGFFYEWFTQRPLPVPDTAANVGYVDAIDANRYLAAPSAEPVRRWRVRDNLPGKRVFCPLVWLGEPEWRYDLAGAVAGLDARFGPELLLRSSAWLTFKESRASFAIEHEADRQDRVRRFAATLAEHSGRLPDALCAESLLTVQRAVLGEAALRVGIRRSPVHVGQSAFAGETVHYIAPPETAIDALLAGLRTLEQRTRGADPVLRAAAVAFGFVYLHPFADGNGRVHRFLINHLLAADGAVPANIIVPVSATIAGSAQGLADYDRALEVFSRPFMHRYAGDYRFGARRVCPDGISTNLEFTAAGDALHAWRHPDLSAHVRYLSALLRQTVEHEMVDEALALARVDAARAAIKRLLEMPDPEADRIIRSLRDGDWSISNKLRRELPEIFAPDGRFHALQDRLVEAVRMCFEEGPPDEPAA
ncbi:Fic family protein [Derxia gummosa]|uniref:Fic family protein n=1 Tax=Derxia gummosa DSM 723 TaxID=1121388 RepID=A0A8B6X833_9BURK|nr:Fic family protein [Derxia gummosa]